MSNVDGLYATTDIEEGVIIFSEDTMPDCSLHRSDNPNCEIVETEQGMAVMSARMIKSGEFFCVPNSDDESSDGDEEADKENEEQDED